MVIYFTSAPKSALKNYFLNFRSYSVIDTKSIQEEEEESIDGNKGNKLIVDMMIEMRIRCELKKAKHKRHNMNIIYIANNIDSEIVDNLREYYDDCDVKVVYVECASLPYVYDETLFDEVVKI